MNTSFSNSSQTLGKAALSPPLLPCSLYECSVSAGFPSPAEEWSGYTLDLNQYLVLNPSATFFVRAFDDSMKKAGIFNGDLLIIDRSLPIRHLDIVVADVQGELTIRRLIHRKGKTHLNAENLSYPSLELNEDMDVCIWGVATNVIHNLHT